MLSCVLLFVGFVCMAFFVPRVLIGVGGAVCLGVILFMVLFTICMFRFISDCCGCWCGITLIWAVDCVWFVLCVVDLFLLLYV